MLSKISATRIITFLTLVFLSSGLLSLSASAVENHYCSLDADPLVCSRNNIIFTAPCGPTKSGGSGECGISVSGSTIEEKIWNGLTSFMTDEQAAGVLGNMAHEGGLSPARHEGSFLSSSPNFDIAANPKTSYGIGLIQWSFGRRVGLYKFFKEKGAEDLWTEYVDEGRSTYGGLQGKDFLSKAGDEVTDKMLNIELCYLKKELEENSQYSGVLEETTVQGAADYFLEKVEIPGNIEGTRPVRRESAQKYYDQFHSGDGVTANTTPTTAGSDSADTVSSSDSSASSSSSSSDPSCNSCEKGSKNINGAAVCLAWPLDTDDEKRNFDGGNPTEAFRSAYKEVGLNTGNNPKTRVGASCDAAVAGVVRYAYDPKFPKGMKEQDQYVKNSDLWEVLPKNTQVQAGDVVRQSGKGWGHVFIVVQDQNGDFYSADGHYGVNGGQYLGIETGVEKSGKITKSNNVDEIWRPTQANNSNVGVDVKNGVSSSSVTGSMSSTGQGNKDIGASALELAWPADKKPECYKHATDKFTEYFDTLPVAKQDANTEYAGGKSCDRFVHATVKYSGIDDDMPTTISEMLKHMTNSPDWEEVQIKAQNSTEGLQDGDVLIWPGHVAIYAKDSSNKEYIVDASNPTRFGYADATSNPSTHGSGGAWRAFRNKNNKSGGGSSCNPCPTGEDGSGASGLKSGGMTLEEAREFMKVYRDEAKKQKRGNQEFQGALVTDSGCRGGALNNCSAFSEWFVNRYTTAGPNIPAYQGSATVKQLLGLNKGFKDGKKVPKAYAVVSMGPFTGTSDGWYNHTGIVLGIDKERNKIIIGEASCSNGYNDKYPNANEYDLDKYTNGSSSYAPVYAYTDDILKPEELK